MNWDFVKKVLPEALEYIQMLYKHFSGDADAAVRNIKDRRLEIEKMWKDAEEALERKHKDDP